MEFWEVLNKRRSTRAFLDKPVEKEKLQKILEAANCAPSAGNLQAYEIYLLDNKQTIKKFTESINGQSFLIQAPVILVFAANPLVSKARYASRGENLYAIQDATIACTFAWLAAVDQGLSAVWVGAFDEEKVRNSLGLNRDLKPVAILPIGYPAENPTPKPRRKLEDLVHKV